MTRVQVRMEAVIFDLGGVLMSNGRPSDAAARFPEADPHQVAEAIMGPQGVDTDHPWHQLERGEITMREYQGLVREHLAALGIRRAPRPPGAEPGGETPGEPREPAFQFELNAAMIELVGDLRAAGLRTAMLTNNVREIRPFWWPLADWPNLLDVIVDSHEVGLRKPGAAIYELTLARVGVTADRAAFLDDLEGNVEGARRVGLHGIHVTGNGADAIARVRELAGLA